MRGASAVFTKTEISTHNDMRKAKAIGNHALRKFAWREGGHGGVKVQLIQPIHTQFLQTAGTGLTAHQAKMGGFGCKVGAGMGFKGHDPQRCVRVCGARQIDHGLMTDVNAVEIPNRDGRAAILGFYELVVSNNTHKHCLARWAR